MCTNPKNQATTIRKRAIAVRGPGRIGKPKKR